MSDIENRTFSQDEVNKLKEVVRQGKQVKQEIADLQEGLRDTVKNVAEMLDVKPKLINQAITTAFKQDLAEKKASMDDLETLLETLGLNS